MTSQSDNEPIINITIDPTSLVSAINQQTSDFQTAFTGFGDTLSDLNLSGDNSDIVNAINDLNQTDYTDLLIEENNYSKMIASDIAEMKSYFDDNSTSTLPEEGSITTLLSNLENDVNGLKNKFTDTKSVLDSGFSFTAPSGVNPLISGEVLGGTITFDLCAAFSPLRPIFSFVFTLIFMYFSIVLFYKGIKL